MLHNLLFFTTFAIQTFFITMKYISFLLLAFILFASSAVEGKTYDLRKYGLQPGSDQNTVPLLAAALQKIVTENPKDSRYVIKFPKGKYNFFPIKEMEKVYYISNHDQDKREHQCRRC